MTDTIPLYLPEEAHKALEVAKENGNSADHRFIDNLMSGYKWQLFVLHALQSYGHWGAIHPLRVRPESSERAHYGDSFDIAVGSGPMETGGWVRYIDVKGRTRTFEDPESFPFPTILVEQMSTFNKRKGDYPHYWCMVSQFNQKMIFLPSMDQDGWRKEVKKGIAYKTAPKESFLSLGAFLEQLPDPAIPG